MTCAYEKIKLWLAELSESQNDNLTLDEFGLCFLSDQQGSAITISAKRNSEHFVISVDLMLINEETKLEAFEIALTLNLYQENTLGGAISYDPQGNTLVLSYLRLIEHTSSAEFQNILGNLASLSQTLRVQLYQSSSRIFQHENKLDNVFDSENFIRI